MSVETRPGPAGFGMSAPDERVMARFHADLGAVRRRVDARLSTLFDRVVADSAAVLEHDSPGLAPLRAMALANGKRIRPAFVYWAFTAAGGDPDDERVIEAGAVLELLHLFALVHDDVMDEAPVRRSRPTIHVLFADRHRALGLRGAAERYGENMAILLGDLAFLVCGELTASLPAPARRVFFRAATQLMLGQYLDLECAAAVRHDPALYSRTALLKTASYTVEGPLLVGAALTPRGDELAPYLRRYGRAIGEAFQHRDDLLDIFGDEQQTGKPVAGDILQQKATRLFAILENHAEGADAALLGAGALDLESVRALLRRTGAADELERVITGLTREAVLAIDEAPMSDACREVLVGAAHFAGVRAW
ncbi:polyprenyl synthetase family protein [Actinophytocola sp.]|uniref:polyprenyl synthetase family protein n=1 Tax=Actinophytocola sp. TaxID=1872138 RepID=UPI00389B1B95